jgi:hypothetical protein
MESEFFLVGSSLASLAFPKLLGELVSAGSEGMLAEKLNIIAILIIATLIIQSTFSYFRVVLFVNVTEKTIARYGNQPIIILSGYP